MGEKVASTGVDAEGAGVGDTGAFLGDTGEMARRIARFDWAGTPIGPIAGWPAVLRHTVGLMLPSPVPLVLLWGEPGVMIYNDAYAGFAGGRDSRLLGSLVREGWQEVADFNDNVMRVGLAGGTLSYRDHELTLHRDGRPEQVFMNLDYSPVRGDDGKPAGVLAVVVETTEAHANRAALEASEDQLRRAQAAGGIGLFVIDVRADTITGTEEFSRIFGLGPCRDVPVKTIEAQVVHPDHGLVSDAARRREGTATLEVEYRVRRADDGEERTIARKAEYEYGGDGKPLRLIGVVQDVTDRRRIQQALGRSEAKFSALAQTMPIQVWTAQADGNLDWFNAQAYAYCGLAPGALLGDGWRAVVHREDLPRAIARWTAALLAGRTYEAEFRLRDSDGVYHWHLARAVPLLDAGGIITGWVGTNTEIEAQKRAEQANARDRDRLWSMSQDLMLVCDQQGRITAINPSGERLLGWPEAAMVGQELAGFVHPDDRAATVAELARVGDGVASLSFENRYRTRDGDYRLMAWTAVSDGGRIHGVGRDVTDQRAIEDALRQSQKMEAVGQLTGGIAHDFNNLLQGIIGGLDMIALRLEEGRADDIPRWLDGVRTSADRAAALTHRLLAFSRRQPLDPRPLKVNPLITGMEDLLRRTLGEAMTLRLVLAGGLWPTLCDANQLESALLNLAINARDAMPGGGMLTIETANVQVEGADAARDADLRAGQYACVSVSDSGTGMSRETIARAFEPFYTTKPIGQGTGLGLSMIYGFARQSGGFARICSELGIGTTIRIYLPRHRAADHAPEVAAPMSVAGSPAGGETVLVVEDEFLVRGLIVEVLEDLGYRVIEANDGQKGLEVLQSRQRIDLLLTDIGLPGLNGRQVADAARLERPGLKVLFMTGYAENAAIASGFLDPGMAMITKPFAMEALTQRVRDIMQA